MLLSLKILLLDLLLPAKEKLCYRKMPFTFVKGQLPLAGSFHYDFVFCQDPGYCRLIVHKGPENLENLQVFVEMMMLQS